LTAREADLPALRRRVEVLMGQYPEGALSSGGRLPGLPGTPPAGIPAEVLERRPDLVASERRLASADRRVVEAKRSLLPAISLTGSHGSSSPELSRLLDGDLSVWNLAGNLAQPILDGQRLRQTVKVRQADVEFALAEYEQSVLTAFQEVEDALSLEQSLAAQEAAVAESVRLADEAMAQSRKAYQAGTGDILTMLNAQQRFITARGALIDIRLQRLENRIDLHLALGGDFRTGRP
jgi:outer membrane protein TolC